MDTIIKNASGERIDYTFATGATEQKKEQWLVLIGHGVTGNKDRPLLTNTADALNSAGFDTLRLSFAGNGESEGDFRQCTISKEIDDLDAVLNAAKSKYQKVCYIGHSMGGAVGILKAAKDDRIDALVSLAGMVDTKAFALTQFGEETPDDGLMWEEENCPLSSAYMTDLCETINSVAPQIDAVSIPWLLLHGAEDDIVLPKDTELVQSAKRDAVEVHFIEGADHKFSEATHTIQATEILSSWLSRQT